MDCIADVITNYDFGVCLEVGVARPHKIYVPINDSQDGKRIAIGFCFSYYEFTQDVNKRLTGICLGWYGERHLLHGFSAAATTDRAFTRFQDFSALRQKLPSFFTRIPLNFLGAMKMTLRATSLRCFTIRHFIA